jgi:hypothetical protein
MVIGASSEVKDPTNVITNSLAEQWTDVSATAQSQDADAPTVVITQLTANSAGNWRHPAVGEDSRGNRLVIFRGPDGKKYYYVYCKKGGTWSSPKVIYGGDQPALIRSLYANIEVDSTDRFHCEWEDAKGAVYATFRDGTWTKPFKIKTRGRYDLTSSFALRSNDEVVFVDCEVLNLSKDIYIHTKRKDEHQFKNPFNASRDKPGSTQPCIAIDSKDNSWVVWKSDYLHSGLAENLIIYLAPFDKNNKDGDIDWLIMSPDPGWTFLPQVAVNNEDKVMILGSWSKGRQYISRLYDPATKTLGPIISLNIGLCFSPWHTFFSRLSAHGKDFYAAVMTSGRVLLLMKFDENTSKWTRVAQVSNRSVEMFDLYSGYDKMLIAWNNNSEPTSVYVTTVSVDPYIKFRVQSVSNLRVEKSDERSFFRRYIKNILTWEANPENTKREIVITAQRIYRKGLTEDNSKWTRITEVAGTVLQYEDRNVAPDSNYVYAVTCVDDKENESEIFKK